jgi:hypothetical protein
MRAGKNLDCKRCGLLCKSTVSALKCTDRILTQKPSWDSNQMPHKHKSRIFKSVHKLPCTYFWYRLQLKRVIITLVPSFSVCTYKACLHSHKKVSIHITMPVHLSVRMLSAYLPLDRLPWYLILGTFMKICQEFLNLVKIKQKYWALNMKT